ncbi:MAG: 2-hydroxyacyl-CoA dehydratase [Lawsonibacter sp.]|jgi:benzoyl-CoA reductase/2-hydroxyglutaryl-CoA dehydratase subunit BcrC/BadD/HgdB|nr:2-hydroxyacyl-CoA dehydratase [Lawsonibacter sp.]
MASNLKSLVGFHEIANAPAKALKTFKEETGEQAVGCFPVWTPEPIVHAGGMLPIGLWGGTIELNKVRAYLPSFACSIMQACMEYEIAGAYDDLAAVIIPALCDTLKAVGQKFKGKCVCIPTVHAQNRQVTAAVDYMVEEYADVKRRVEEATGKTITDEALSNSLAVYNEHNAVMREFAALAAEKSAYLTAADRHAVMKSAWFVRKEKHTAMVRALIDELKALPAKEDSRKRVVLSGIMAEPVELLDIMERCGVVVVGDDLAQESRQYTADYPDGGAPLERMARQWCEGVTCSLAYDPKKPRVDQIVRLVQDNKADGVVVCLMKFCDPEEFDYPFIRRRLEQEDIPHILLDIDQQITSYGQAQTKLQGFAEIL